MSKLDLKLLAWASMWVVTSLTVVGNPGIRSCDMGRENEFDFGTFDLRCLGNLGANLSSRFLFIWVLRSVGRFRMEMSA